MKTVTCTIMQKRAGLERCATPGDGAGSMEMDVALGTRVLVWGRSVSSLSTSCMVAPG